MQFNGPLYRNVKTTITTAPVVVSTRVVSPQAARTRAVGRRPDSPNLKGAPKGTKIVKGPAKKPVPVSVIPENRPLSETLHQKPTKSKFSKEERPAVIAARRAEALRKRENLKTLLERAFGTDYEIKMTEGNVIRRGALDTPVKKKR